MKKIAVLFTTLVLVISLGAQEKYYTLEESILKEATTFYPKRMLNIQWLDNLSFSSTYADNLKELNIISAETGQKIQTLSIDDFSWPEGVEVKGFQGISWENAKSFKLMNSQQLLLINKDDKSVNTLIANIDKEAANLDYHDKNKKLAYTKKNNLYVQDKDTVIAITQIDNDNIVSGQAIHRFEMGITKGTFWSPWGDKLAYYQKDETKVKNYPLVDITTTPASLKNIKYPMAGQDSEEGNVWVYNFNNGENIKLEKQGGREDYVTNLAWTPNGKQILIAEVNRAQKEMNLNLFDAQDGKFIKTVYKESNDKWVEPEHPAFFINDSTFIWMSEKDGFMNLYQMQLHGKEIKQITKNHWEAISIFDKSRDGDVVYFYGTGDSPLDKKLFAVEVASGKQWEVTSEGGRHNLSSSPSKLYFIDQWTSSKIPMRVDLLSNEGKTINNFMKSEDPMLAYQKAIVDLGTIKAGDNTTDLYYRMIKPHDFNPNKKYPVLLYVYGGPHAQMITNSYHNGAPLWMHWMANQGYIVFTLDNRGSANRGFEFESAIHRNLGKVEMQDQLAGIDFLTKQPFVNMDKIAVHGWSYGGFMTASLMLNYPNIFQVGVAGGAVTNWEWYEIMYCERYMDHPKSNPHGFKNTQLMDKVDNLQGNLLLIHGTTDDIVVMQHSLALTKAFIEAGKQVDFFPYPMHPHNVRGKDRVHLMRKVLQYIQDKLDEPELGE